MYLRSWVFPPIAAKGKNSLARPNFEWPFEDDVRVQDAIVAELDVRSDDAKRPDADIASQRGER